MPPIARGQTWLSQPLPVSTVLTLGGTYLSVTIEDSVKKIIYNSLVDLTRFNKIATQGAPQMAVDKEANSLSRVYSYYSKFILCLFYM